MASRTGGATPGQRRGGSFGSSVIELRPGNLPKRLVLTFLQGNEPGILTHTHTVECVRSLLTCHWFTVDTGDREAFSLESCASISVGTAVSNLRFDWSLQPGFRDLTIVDVARDATRRSLEVGRVWQHSVYGP